MMCLLVGFSMQKSNAQKRDSLKITQRHIKQIATELNINIQKAAQVEHTILTNRVLITNVTKNTVFNVYATPRYRVMIRPEIDTAFSKTMAMLNPEELFKLRVYLLKGKMHQDSLIQHNAEQLQHPVKGGTFKSMLIQKPNHQ